MKRIVRILLISIGISTNCLADELMIPFTYITVADSRTFYFRMVPDPNPERMWNLDSAGSGAVYEVSPDGKDRLVWSISGWYAYSTYLSYDGEYLVRMGVWPPGMEPSNEHLGVAFYKHGQLLKQYSTKDLLKDATKVGKSVSHYTYLSAVYGFEYYTYNFSLTSVDGIVYTFDVRTGDIISRIATSEKSTKTALVIGEKDTGPVGSKGPANDNNRAGQQLAGKFLYYLLAFVGGCVLGVLVTYAALRRQRKSSA